MGLVQKLLEQRPLKQLEEGLRQNRQTARSNCSELQRDLFRESNQDELHNPRTGSPG